MKIVIVGGVAGGASAAAKARRVNEHAQIVIFEKGPYVSFANCGLPYYVGGEISERAALLQQTPEGFRRRFAVEAKVLHEVVSIDRAAKSVRVKNLKTGDVFHEKYDKLILSPGAGAIVPPLEGVSSKNIFTIKTVPDSDAIRDFIGARRPRRAVVVGGGFIGLEAAEAFKRLGLEVTVVEMLPQVLPPFDPEIAAFVARHLEEQGVQLILGDGIQAFHGDGETAREVELSSGRRLPMDFAILSIGVRPELKLAREAGLEIGSAGGIAVDAHQRTSDPDIYAAGDAVEIPNLVTGRKGRIPLAGAAGKQGRVAGANAAGEALTFPGALGTAIVETMGITAAKTGLSEREAAQAGYKFFVSQTHSLDHAGYYPGSSLLHMKLLAEQGTGRLLGAQVVGERGVDKRIDVLATAVSAGLKVTDLENLDLAYAPQFSAARDPVIMAGLAASDSFRGDVRTVTCEAVQKRMSQGERLQLVDVRTQEEYKAGHLEGARLIPVDELRARLAELDPALETVVYCRVGLRGYIAARILMQSGFKSVSNITGGVMICPAPAAARPEGSSNGRVSVETLREALAQKTALALDVREPDEYAHRHIAGTRNVPLSRLPAGLPELSPGHEFYVFCQSGPRAFQAAQIMRSRGLKDVHIVEGGLNAWAAAGYPVEKSGGPIPIMRQVQIVAGSLAFLGGLVPSLRWIAIIVGAGLVFAGVSGTCGMAAVLARMPWNKAPQSGAKPDRCDPCSPRLK